MNNEDAAVALTEAMANAGYRNSPDEMIQIEAGKGMGVKTSFGYMTHVENGSFIDDDFEKCVFTIFKIGDQYFRIEGVYNSWDITEFCDPFEVVQRPVTRYEYLRKSEGDQNV